MKIEYIGHGKVTVALPFGVPRGKVKEVFNFKPGDSHEFTDEIGAQIISRDPEGRNFRKVGSAPPKAEAKMIVEDVVEKKVPIKAPLFKKKAKSFRGK